MREEPKAFVPPRGIDLNTKDTGDRVQRRLELDLDKNRGLFLYGDQTTAHPLGRRSGEDYQPNLPNSSPKDSFGVGVGIKKQF